MPCEVNRLAPELGIPDAVGEQSRRICCGVVGKGLLKTKSLPVIAATSMYAACRESRTPVTIRELAAASRSNTTEIARCYRSILGEMGITPQIPNGTTYTLRVASKIGISREATDLSLKVVRKAAEQGFGVRNPMTLAAAAVYTACLSMGENVRQYDVADAAGVSEMSVRNCSKAMRRLITEPF